MGGGAGMRPVRYTFTQQLPLAPQLRTPPPRPLAWALLRASPRRAAARAIAGTSLSWRGHSCSAATPALRCSWRRCGHQAPPALAAPGGRAPAPRRSPPGAGQAWGRSTRLRPLPLAALVILNRVLARALELAPPHRAAARAPAGLPLLSPAGVGYCDDVPARRCSWRRCGRSAALDRRKGAAPRI